MTIIDFCKQIFDPNKDKAVEQDLADNYDEDRVVQAIIENKLVFRSKRVNVWSDSGFVSRFGRFKLYTEKGGICGSFPYFMVNGKDVSNAHHPRLDSAITNKIDIGINKQYSWIWWLLLFFIDEIEIGEILCLV